jgi:hypothetical protein
MAGGAGSGTRGKIRTSARLARASPTRCRSRPYRQGTSSPGPWARACPDNLLVVAATARAILLFTGQASYDQFYQIAQ